MARTEIDAQTARRRKLIGTGLVVVLAAALIAIVVVRSNGEKLLNENADTLVLVGKEAGAGKPTVTRGQLTDVGGCLALTSDGGPAIVIWPHGTTVETPDPLRVTVGDSTYKLGETVELDGVLSDPLAADSYFYDRVSELCRTSPTFVAHTS